MTAVEKKTCQICKATTDINDDVIFFGNWVEKKDFKVHYYCLLFSNDLPQNGPLDTSGLHGFLIADIRNFIKKIKDINCYLCKEPNASIRCSGGCNKCYHLVCGRRNDYSFIFDSNFQTFCDDCVVKEDFYIEALKMKPDKDACCFICFEKIGFCKPTSYIYGTCCGKGYAHRFCMQKYALEAGYYLCCIWCKDKNFRDTVRKQGIFVPDQDAAWERNKKAYDDLHRPHRRCDVDICRCLRGRDYIGGKWDIILCALCGSYGVHYPQCIQGLERKAENGKQFTCNTCAAVVGSRELETINASLEATIGSSCVNSQEISLANSSLEEIQCPKESSMKENENTCEAVVASKEMNVSGVSIHSNQKNSLDNSSHQSIDAIRTDIQYPKESSLTENVNENSFTLDVFKFDNQYMICRGTGKMHINLNDERFKNKTKDQIIQEKLYNENDLISETDDTGLFKEADKIISQFL